MSVHHCSSSSIKPLQTEENRKRNLIYAGGRKHGKVCIKTGKQVVTDLFEPIIASFKILVLHF